jgi:hypothetical protein
LFHQRVWKHLNIFRISFSPLEADCPFASPPQPTLQSVRLSAILALFFLVIRDAAITQASPLPDSFQDAPACPRFALYLMAIIPIAISWELECLANPTFRNKPRMLNALKHFSFLFRA